VDTAKKHEADTFMEERKIYFYDLEKPISKTLGCADMLTKEERYQNRFLKQASTILEEYDSPTHLMIKDEKEKAAKLIQSSSDSKPQPQRNESGHVRNIISDFLINFDNSESGLNSDLYLRSDLSIENRKSLTNSIELADKRESRSRSNNTGSNEPSQVRSIKVDDAIKKISFLPKVNSFELKQTDNSDLF